MMKRIFSWPNTLKTFPAATASVHVASRSQTTDGGNGEGKNGSTATNAAGEGSEFAEAGGKKGVKVVVAGPKDDASKSETQIDKLFKNGCHYPSLVPASLEDKRNLLRVSKLDFESAKLMALWRHPFYHYKVLHTCPPPNSEVMYVDRLTWSMVFSLGVSLVVIVGAVYNICVQTVEWYRVAYAHLHARQAIDGSKAPVEVCSKLLSWNADFMLVDEKHPWVLKHKKPKGTKTEGTKVEGTKTEGTKTEGTKVEGTKVEGTKTEGTKTEGTKVEGTETEGTNAAGTEGEGTTDAFLLFVVGPKVVGKTMTCNHLPAKLEYMPFMIRYRPDSNNSFIDFLYDKLLALTPGYPARPKNEDKTEYIRKVLNAKESDYVLVVDLLRSQDDAAMSQVVDNLREVFELGVRVIATTSEGQDMVSTKTEPRRTVLSFTELPMGKAVAVYNSMWETKHGAKIAVSDKEPKSADELRRESQRQSGLEAIPRDYLTIAELVNLKPEKFDEFVKNKKDEQQHKALGAMKSSGCTKSGQPPKFDLQKKLATLESVITEEELLDLCKDDQKTGTSNLVKRNVLRPIGGVPTAAGVDRSLLTWQYESLLRALEYKEK